MSHLQYLKGEDIVRVLRSLGFYVTETRKESVVLTRGIHRLEIPLGEMDAQKSMNLRRMLKPVFDHQDWLAIKRIRDWVILPDPEIGIDEVNDGEVQKTPKKTKVRNS